MAPKVFTIHYKLNNDNGETVDTSIGGEPLVFLEGSKQVIPGLDQAVRGRDAGECLAVTVPAELAYGRHNPNLVSEVPVSEFEGIDEVKVGMKFQTGAGEDAQVVQVVEVGPQFVKIDANHPLAGFTLNFELEVVSVREATESEVQNGMATRD